MIFHLAYGSRGRSTPFAAFLLGLAFASGVHAQTERAVASVEVAQHSPAAGAGDAAALWVQPSVAAVQPQTEMPPQPLHVRSIDIGSATQTLLEMQRASPGVRPRPIDGEQAGRSYQRYLKSFETTIPEHYGSGLGVAKK